MGFNLRYWSTSETSEQVNLVTHGERGRRAKSKSVKPDRVASLSSIAFEQPFGTRKEKGIRICLIKFQFQALTDVINFLELYSGLGEEHQVLWKVFYQLKLPTYADVQVKFSKSFRDMGLDFEQTPWRNSS